MPKEQQLLDACGNVCTGFCEIKKYLSVEQAQPSNDFPIPKIETQRFVENSTEAMEEVSNLRRKCQQRKERQK